MKSIFNKAGFTLVEMLAVIAIFITIGSIVMSILVTSFRTSNKTNIVTAVQHNGNYALTQMAKTIRDARGLISPFPCVPSVSTNSLTILTPDDQQVTYACVAATSTPATIASNGASLLDTNTVSVSSCSFTCSQVSSSDLPIIRIDFALSQQSGNLFTDMIASQSAVDFQTSVGIRNINR